MYFVREMAWILGECLLESALLLLSHHVFIQHIWQHPKWRTIKRMFIRMCVWVGVKINRIALLHLYRVVYIICDQAIYIPECESS